MTTPEYPLHERELARSSKFAYLSSMAALKKGWQIRRLERPYCSAGGAAKYSYCLYDGERGLGQITDQVAQQLPGVEHAELISLDNTMLVLQVAYGDKQAVKDAGATWMPEFHHWGCMPSEANRLERWLMKPRVEVRSLDDLISLKVPKHEEWKAKQAGAFRGFGPMGQGWVGLRAMRGRLLEWV